MKYAGEFSRNDVNFCTIDIQQAARLTPVVTKCNKIHEEYLQKVDKELYDHLTKLEIEPQLYGM